MEKKKYAAYGMLLAGTALLAVGVQNFLEPMELVAGGISGLGMILDDVSRRLGGVERKWYAVCGAYFPNRFCILNSSAHIGSMGD